LAVDIETSLKDWLSPTGTDPHENNHLIGTL